MWFASLDLTKAFDKIEHDALFQALLRQGVPPSYLALLTSLYRKQTGSVQGGRSFSIKRGVKQGDVISPMLFNAGLEHAMRNWKQKLRNHGLHVGKEERLTNVRFADDIMLYAKSCSELMQMLESLILELGAIGLQLNSRKTKILTTASLASPTFLEVAGSFVEVLWGDLSHSYLGKLLCGDLSKRSSVELRHRIQAAWAKFRNHKQVLCNPHISLKLRLQFFEATITPSVLYGVTTLPLTQSQLDRLDAAQRRMLRSIVGWVRIEGEDWRDTMHRMKLRLQHALAMHPLRPWTQQLFTRQYRFASKISRRDDAWPWAVVTWIPGDGW